VRTAGSAVRILAPVALPEPIETSLSSRQKKLSRSKGWVTIKIRADEMAAARAIAQCGFGYGANAGNYIRAALRSQIREDEERLRITEKQAVRISRTERIAYHNEFFSLINRLGLYGIPLAEKN